MSDQSTSLEGQGLRVTFADDRLEILLLPLLLMLATRADRPRKGSHWLVRKKPYRGQRGSFDFQEADPPQRRSEGKN